VLFPSQSFYQWALLQDFFSKSHSGPVHLRLASLLLHAGLLLWMSWQTPQHLPTPIAADTSSAEMV
jgi:hypothetical protein